MAVPHSDTLFYTITEKIQIDGTERKTAADKKKYHSRIWRKRMEKIYSSREASVEWLQSCFVSMVLLDLGFLFRPKVSIRY